MRIVAADEIDFVSAYNEDIETSHDAFALHGRATFPKSVSDSRNNSKNLT